MRVAKLARQYNRKAVARDWPLRTAKAVELRRRHLATESDYSRQPRAVRCVLSGQEWPSIRAAAKAVGTPSSNLVMAFQRNGRWKALVPCDNMGATNKSHHDQGQLHR
jgi:hypothetical protein